MVSFYRVWTLIDVVAFSLVCQTFSSYYCEEKSTGMCACREGGGGGSGGDLNLTLLPLWA